jgi:exodeoxyribonuclease VII small subunit
MTYEKHVDRLEAIVSELEGDEVELDAALRLFAEGIECLRAAAAELERADAEVRRLVERDDGTFELPTLDR